MRAPDFWTRDGIPSRLLAPLGSLYAWAVFCPFAWGMPPRYCANPVS